MSGRSFGAVVAQLAQAQKPSAGTPAYSRFLNRRLGRYLAAGAFLLGRTPNQVSLASGFCSLVGIGLIALTEPSVPLAIGVTLLLVLGYALDSADGQLARLRGGGSPLGEWLDHMIDCVKICLLHSAVLISFFRFDAFSNDVVLLVPLAYLCVSAVMFFGLILIDQLRRRHGGVTANVRGDSIVKSLLIAPTDYGILCLVFLAFGWPTAFVLLYGLLLAANLLFLLAAIAKWYREMAALRPAAQVPSSPGTAG
ncbi:CDP-alcohol phosphatidyltransferase-like enzyme [Kribbella amoyensis]|uniref:CDP-alcohol phosphatidyltransferase-like enzyme n=1 Tax=Kribbella amoyensis TaxID=996641 RepID=A0A561BWV1_9ACTN|nr:CDP-alcohol phosphatidyltransferase family protein [Kribbella amoyensis]TWD83313.1 CDP-alcohol phosphatidyltransferase-like enzyme [Kribbella amoyensis]